MPQSLAIDAWWLDTPTPGPAEDPGADSAALSRLARQGGAVLALVALADLLFWHHAPGLSLVLFAAAIFAAALHLSGSTAWRRPALLLAAAALPVIDHLQALSFAFLALGLAAALIWIRHPEAPAALVARRAAALLARLPLSWLRLLDPRCLLAPGTGWSALGGRMPSTRALLRNWAFPAGGGLILLALLMQANPVLAHLLEVDIRGWAILRRLLFWSGMAIFVIPFLLPPADPAPMARTRRAAPALPGLGLNPASVLRALLVFNALIAVQSLTDLTILLFGADLPEGMTLAEYAHRGAYPLLATAILAGAFALAARPFLGEHRLIRPLLLLWLGQNMVLCGAAALRLELYVEAFGLTYLRLHALIWMALVAAYLGLLLWQVLRGRSNGWLVTRAVVLGLGTLYLASFVNFAQIVAAQNLTRPDPDLHYICALGPLAVKPVVDSGAGLISGAGILLADCNIPLPETGGWREWGFRSWAAERYVMRVTNEERPR